MKKGRMKFIATLTLILLLMSIATAGASAASSGIGDLRGAEFFKAVTSGSDLDENSVQQIKDYLNTKGNFRDNAISTFVAKEKIMARDPVKRTLDLEFRGTVMLSDTCSVYQFLNHKLLPGALNDIMVGAQNIYVIFNTAGQAQVILIDGDTNLADIRVGISNTAMTTMDLEKIDMLSNDGFILTDKIAGDSFEIEPGIAVSFIVDTAAGAVNVLKAGTLLCSTTNRLYAEPVSEESMIQITSIRRGYGIPSYRGFFEITISKTAPDKLRLINELSMEKYLYQVVPSEMPASFGPEALKAQAVAARTYAINECFSNAALASQGIFVYDSVLSQVYNNSAENTLTNQAVNETAGMILMKDGKYVDCRYYSTSGGFGASKHEVWADPDGSFPGVPVPYLTARSYTYDPLDSSKMYSMDTSDESAINSFYKDLSYTGYDSESLYFRWKVGLTKQELENTINKNIKLRYAADSKFILTRDESGNFVSKPIPAEGIGTLMNMYVAKRGAGGNMMELVIEGSSGTYKIIKEYNIRFTIRPTRADTGSSSDILAYRAKGGSSDYSGSAPLKNPSILYSAFCTFDIEKDADGNVLSVMFYGGGNGHGAGMSQYGAQCLGLIKGFTYDQILNEYYGGSELVNMYDYQSETSVPDRVFKILNDIYEEKEQNSMSIGE